jgi:asparagine synthase (glutamine-hydrolysing)
MSGQFGSLYFDGRPISPQDFERVSPLLVPRGPNGLETYQNNGVAIFSWTLQPRKDSVGEETLRVLPSGAILVWDGRLDNREELLSDCGGAATSSSSDVAIVAAAFERWDTDCFAKLLGDWALTMWHPDSQTLLFAKDFLGSRHLYYSHDEEQIRWSSLLAPLALLREKSLTLDEEYVAGWISSFSRVELTPYSAILAVPPASYVEFRHASGRTRTYWDFDSHKTVRYASDAEYEEHFRNLFTAAVQRRLRSDRPVLAELSGGMDSSSIVCVADTLLSANAAETPRLDTVSYFDDSEPNWDERPYFSLIEQKRGRTGVHIESRWDELFTTASEDGSIAASPAEFAVLRGRDRQLAQHVSREGYAVLLSGIGGDEMVGGVPTPIPELADLLVQARLAALGRRTRTWAFSTRKPWVGIVSELLTSFIPPACLPVPDHLRKVDWLDPRFVRRQRDALCGYPARLKLSGALPSFSGNLRTLAILRRQLASSHWPAGGIVAKTYPFLDRSLLEFLFAIPREQLVRPGERRSLLRRAFRQIVPAEILSRRRKAFIVRAPLTALASLQEKLPGGGKAMHTADFGFVDSRRFVASLERAVRGEAVPVRPLVRAIFLEEWLAQLSHWKLPAKISKEPRSALSSSRHGAVVSPREGRFISNERR